MVAGDTPSTVAQSLRGTFASRIATTAWRIVVVGSGSSFGLVFFDRPRDRGEGAGPDTIDVSAPIIRFIIAACACSAVSSDVTRSSSASNAASRSGFAGRPAGFGVIASMIASITRCKIVWK
jgi:hypothetical protein